MVSLKNQTVAYFKSQSQEDNRFLRITYRQTLLNISLTFQVAHSDLILINVIIIIII